MSNGLGIALFWVGAIAGLTTGLGALTRATLYNTAVTLINANVTKLGTKEKEDFTKATEGGAKAFRKLTLEQQAQSITTLATIISTKGLKAGFATLFAPLGKTIKGIQALVVSFGKLIAVTSGVLVYFAAAAIAIGLIAFLVIKAGRNTEFFAKKIQKTNKELSELSSKERDVKKLTDRFTELDKKVAKTSQDLEEMNSIADQLSEVEFGGETFQITDRDITGRIRVDEDEYNRFIALVQQKRDELIQANIGTFQAAIARDMESTLDNTTMMKVFESIGYDFGLTFIEGLGTGLSENVSKRLKDAAKDLADNFSPEDFMSDGSVYIDGNKNKDEAGNYLRFATKEAAEEYLNMLYEAGEITKDDFDKKLAAVRESNRDVVDTAAYEAFINGLMSTMTQTFTDLENTIQNITNTMTEGPERTAAIFEASANAYAEAEQHLRDTITDPEVLQQSIDFLGETMFDEAILNDLINEKQIDAVVIARMSFDLSMEQITNLFDSITDMLPEDLGEAVIQGLRDDLEGVFSLLFAGDGSLFGQGFDLLKESLRATGEYTEEEIDGIIMTVSRAIRTLTTQEVAGLLKDQMDLAKDIFDLPAQIAKGDFSKFAALVETYGLDATQGVLNGNEDALAAFFNTQNTQAIGQIDESILKITETAKALGRELTDAEKNEIAALELMKGYYTEIATQQQLRNYRLAEAKELIKEMNDLLSIQAQLLELGVDAGPLFDILGEIAEAKEEASIQSLLGQVDRDLGDLEKYRDANGFFKPDNAGMGEAAIEEALESIGLLVNAVTASYNRQKKVVEDRYKGEIDAIKDGHNERGSMIDYTNKLGEAEEKIADARRKLMGLAISGVSRGTLEQAQKDLKKLQEERQKIIEEQMIDKAQKELEQQMNDELMEIQQEMTEELRSLNEQIEALRNVFLQLEVAGGNQFGVGRGEGDNQIVEDLAFTVDEIGISAKDFTKGLADATAILRIIANNTAQNNIVRVTTAGSGGGSPQPTRRARWLRRQRTWRCDRPSRCRP
jgi:hypothetical protein